MTRSYTIPRNFRRVVRRIQRHGTYSCCQLSYDVGQRVSIAGRHRAWNDLSTFILYAKWKTPFTRDEGGSIDAPIPREKLYENRSYLRACPRRQADGAVARRSRDHAAPRPDGIALDYGRGPSPVAPMSGVRKGARTCRVAWWQSPERGQATYGRSRPSGNPRGSGTTFTSRARTPAGRNGTPRCRTRT